MAARLTRRTQSPGEEIANSLSHGFGFLAALLAVPFLLAGAVERGPIAAVVGASVFSLTVVLLYLVSTIYHALPPNQAKQAFQVLDHVAIYLLIAGTYTPFTLGVLRGPWGWTLCGLVWALGLTGVVLQCRGRMQTTKRSLWLYLAMGWLVLVVAKPLWLSMPNWGLFWLAAGGLAYTAGVAFYTARGIRYSHFVWHLFVIMGSTCHFIAVGRYAV